MEFPFNNLPLACWDVNMETGEPFLQFVDRRFYTQCTYKIIPEVHLDHQVGIEKIISPDFMKILFPNNNKITLYCDWPKRFVWKS